MNMGRIGYVIKKVNKKYRVRIEDENARAPWLHEDARASANEYWPHTILEYFPDNFDLIEGPNPGLWIDESHRSH